MKEINQTMEKIEELFGFQKWAEQQIETAKFDVSIETDSKLVTELF